MTEMNARLARRVRHRRVRNKIKGTGLRPRLCVFRSLSNIYAQIIDDASGQTLVSMSTLDAGMRDKTEETTSMKKAELVGSVLARKALDKGIKSVLFDRGGYKYHGRVKALAEAARQAGLEF